MRQLTMHELTITAFWFFCLLGLFCGYQDAYAQPALRFGIYPNKNPKVIRSLYQPVAELLSEATGRKVNLITAPNNTVFEERTLAGNYDLAVACVSCYFKLYDQAGYRAIVRGAPSFHGSVFVKKESPFTDPLQLRGKKVASIAKHSYAGHIFFPSYLDEHGEEGALQADYKILTKPNSVIYAVLNGTVDAGIVRLDLLKSAHFTKYKEQIRVLLLSQPIPHFPFIVPPDMDPQLVRQITEALTGMKLGDPAAKKLFKALKITSLEEVSEDDYKQFRNEYEKGQKMLLRQEKSR